eukprot:COSAG05_NODE_13772_length_418_cov_1.137931_2_plen_56_part_01
MCVWEGGLEGGKEKKEGGNVKKGAIGGHSPHLKLLLGEPKVLSVHRLSASQLLLQP